MGFLVAWTPYTVVSWISAFGDPNSISPVYATLPALFAKSQVLWNPLVYVATNKNFRQRLPFFKTQVQAESKYSEIFFFLIFKTKFKLKIKILKQVKVILE